MAQHDRHRLSYGYVALAIVMLSSAANAIFALRTARWELAAAGLFGVALAAASAFSISRILQRQSARSRDIAASDASLARRNAELVGASEDLCARLQSLASHADQLRRSRSGVSEQQRILEVIAATASEVEARLRRLVDVSAIQLGTVSLNRDLFSVGPVLERAARTHDRAARSRGVSVYVEPCPLLSVVADRERIGLVVGSLLEHSIESASAGTELLLSAVPTVDEIRFSLLDVGGIDSLANRDASATTADDIGLQLCRHIIEAHGGRMGLDSNRLGHARWFTLPADPRMFSS